MVCQQYSVRNKTSNISLGTPRVLLHIEIQRPYLRMDLCFNYGFSEAFKKYKATKV